MNKAERLWKPWFPGNEVKGFVGFGQNMPEFKGAKQSHSPTSGYAVSLEDSLSLGC